MFPTNKSASDELRLKKGRRRIKKNKHPVVINFCPQYFIRKDISQFSNTRRIEDLILMIVTSSEGSGTVMLEPTSTVKTTIYTYLLSLQ